MPADQLTPAEAAEVSRIYQEVAATIEHGAERQLSATRELVELIASPSMVLQRPADFISTETFFWPQGEAIPHVAQVQPTLDRVRLIITWDSLYPICWSNATFSTDNATAAGGTSERGPWHGTAMAAPTWYGADAINFFGSGTLILHTRGPLFIAPAPLFVLNNSGDCHVSITQELTRPPGGGSTRCGHARGCGCGG